MHAQRLIDHEGNGSNQGDTYSYLLAIIIALKIESVTIESQVCPLLKHFRVEQPVIHRAGNAQSGL